MSLGREPSTGAQNGRGGIDGRALLALALATGLAAWWCTGLGSAPALGWDESMHAALPAARMRVALGAGAFGAAADALLDCAQYPFGYPLVLALAQTFGVSELACRVAGTLVWGLALWGLYLCGRELERALERPARLLPWLAPVLGALSPLALAYSGTLFLEVPFACAAVFTLHAWMRRTRDGDAWTPRRELAAGAWLAASFFVKFNYGALLVAGLSLDWLVESALAVRAGRGAASVRRASWLWSPLALACAWWFLLPLPGGGEVASEHRAAFAAFLGGNREFAPTPYALRLLHAGGYLSLNPMILGLELVALACTLAWIRRPLVRTLWCVLCVLWVAVLAHPFHLDRFLVPCAVPLWLLAALGAERLLRQRDEPVFARVKAALILLLFGFSSVTTLRLARSLGYESAQPEVAAYQREVFDGWHALGPGRALPTAGLQRAEFDALLALVAAEAPDEQRIGWIGVSSEFAPGALHIGLLERGGSRARFLRDATQELDVTYFDADPAWDDARLAQYAARFDVVFFTRPTDLKSRAGRAFLGAYAERLAGMPGWSAREIGRVEIARPLREPLAVTVHACRPPR